MLWPEGRATGTIAHSGVPSFAGMYSDAPGKHPRIHLMSN